MGAVSALRLPSTKPAPARSNFVLFVRYTFRTTASTVSNRDVSAIEHLLRKGRRLLDLLEGPGVRDIGISEEMRAWERNNGLRIGIGLNH
jgi:succinate dehydrogenase assembly factor 1